MAVLLAVHLACGALALALAPRIGRGSLLVAAAAPAAAVMWWASQLGPVLDGSARTESVEWVPALGLTLDLRLDGFAAVMVALVSGVGLLVLAYAWSYLGAGSKAGKVAGLLVLFSGAMLAVVLADNVLVLFVGWELTSVTSYLLIGLDHHKPEARASAQHALLVTGAGGLVMFGGLVLLAQEAGTHQLSGILAAPPSGSTVSVALALILVGAFTKSAQYPFQGWLPDAMVAPTPISAYLHAAAMVKAGVYLVARLAPAFADLGWWRPTLAIVGLTTMLAGGWRALRAVDLKQLLAYGTISQLGLLMTLFGWGHPATTAAACALLTAHALFKAALFMVVGIVDHQEGTRDLRHLPRLGPGWSTVRLVAVVSAASMAAVPPLAGFVAKEQALGALLEGGAAERLTLIGIVLGSILTVAYSLRFVIGVVAPVRLLGGPARPVSTAPPSRAFVVPAAVLAAVTVAIGVFPRWWSDLVDGGASALDPRAHGHLVLWHGFNTALLLSAVTLLGGAALFAARAPVVALQERTSLPFSASGAFHRLVRAVLSGSARVTRRVQPGSLPVSATVVMGVAAVAPLVALATGPWWSGLPDGVGGPVEVAVAALLVAGGLAATLARRRFAAAVLLGVVGYAMALLFVAHGAPDLALTQVGVETLSVVVFLLVFRHLPDRFERSGPRPSRLVRLLVAGAVGVMVSVAALAAAGTSADRDVSAEVVERAKPDGDGANVVNVILVDVRGLDTLGEMTVLVVAALGITSLVGAGRRARQGTDRGDRDVEEVVTP